MRINLLFVCLKTPISESSVLMFVEHNLIKNIKIFTLAFTLTVVLNSAIPFNFATCCYPFQLYLSGVDATVRNAVNLVYLWLAWCRSHFMRDVLHQSVEPASLFFTDRRHDRQPGVCSPVCLCNITLAIGDALALWIDQPIRLATSVLAWFGGADWHQMQHVSCGKFL